GGGRDRGGRELRAGRRVAPKPFGAWFFLGNCYYELGQFPEAITCYSACDGLRPEPSLGYFTCYHRSMVYTAWMKNRLADTESRRALEYLPSLSRELVQRERPRAHVQRARVLIGQKDYAAAETVLTEALDLQGPEIQLLLERAQVRSLRGNWEGARHDREEGLRQEPTDEMGWNTRGLARLADDPRGALADFDAALAVNPRYYPALQNKAHVLAEKLGQPDESLAILNRI